MTFAERGLYITLLSHAWLEGSIPNNVAQIARLVRSPEKEIAKIWSAVAVCFTTDGCDRLINKRMDTVREGLEAYHERQSARGKAGAKARWDHGASMAPAMLTPLTDHSEPCHKQAMLDDGSASASASSSASGEIASLSLHGEREKKSPEFNFATWFVAIGLETGAIPAHRGLDPLAAAMRESLVDAKALLATYGREECETRSRRFFAAVVARTIRRSPSIASLAEAWDWDVVAGRKSTRLASVDEIIHHGFVRTADGIWHPFRGAKRPIGWADGMPDHLPAERRSEVPWTQEMGDKIKREVDDAAEAAEAAEFAAMRRAEIA